MSTPIRALVVDDEELGRRNLCLALGAHPHWQVVAQAASVAAAEEALQAQPGIDVVFLDIRMPKQSGLQLARRLSQQAEPPWVVFVTAFDEHAVEAFELHALDYVLKPFSNRRLAQALARVGQLMPLKQRAAYGAALRRYVDDTAAGDLPTYWQQLSVRSVGHIETVAVGEIQRIEAQGNYAELHLPTRRLLFRAPMAQLETHLDPTEFLRVHRSTIVRRDLIASLHAVEGGNYELRLRQGGTVSVSERYVAAVKGAMRTG